MKLWVWISEGVWGCSSGRSCKIKSSPKRVIATSRVEILTASKTFRSVLCSASVLILEFKKCSLCGICSWVWPGTEFTKVPLSSRNQWTWLSASQAWIAKTIFMVKSITTKFLTWLNLVMNGLIKQLFTPNCPAAHLTEHKTEDLRRTCWCGLESNFVLIFTKWIDVTTS